jgi:hypothetical protein
MMNVEAIKIKFLKSMDVPMQSWVTHCECCGAEPDGFSPYWFSAGDIVDPDELHHRLDLTSLVFGEDYEIVEFIPGMPDLY